MLGFRIRLAQTSNFPFLCGTLRCLLPSDGSARANIDIITAEGVFFCSRLELAQRVCLLCLDFSVRIKTLNADLIVEGKPRDYYVKTSHPRRWVSKTKRFLLLDACPTGLVGLLRD